MLDGAREWSWTYLTYYSRVTVSLFKKTHKQTHKPTPNTVLVGCNATLTLI